MAARGSTLSTRLPPVFLSLPSDPVPDLGFETATLDDVLADGAFARAGAENER